MLKGIISGLAALVFLFLFSFNGFCETKAELCDKLDQAKEDYYSQKNKIDNQVRELSKKWHMKHMALRDKLQANPEQAEEIKEQIWQGANELSKKKKELYSKLTPLRKSWYNQRMELEEKIAEK
ncbi:MAG: DUF4527 domain-containing protein [Candidatus Omnitrophica bacterium]|nr:DUF4527 domain-containing protein [Candidatus Omnitrophota bacterium]